MSDKFLAVIIVAGGTGSRMGNDLPKQFLKIDGKEIIEYTIDAFIKSQIADKIFVVCHNDYLEHMESIVKKTSPNLPFEIVQGGDNRQKSVYNGLKKAYEYEYVMIHDAVRCCITKEEILSIYGELVKNGSCALGVKTKDTIKVVDSEDAIVQTLDRTHLVQIQTPQAFETKVILKAHENAIKQGIESTDDCSLVENMGQRVNVVYGSYDNIKITTPGDMLIAKEILKRQ